MRTLHDYDRYKEASKFPHVCAAIAKHVENDGFALRVLHKAVNGEELYRQIAREAFKRRHKK